MTRQEPTQKHAHSATPTGGDKTVRRRVLHWLHQQQQPSTAVAAPAAAVEQTTTKAASAHTTAVTGEMRWKARESLPVLPRQGSRGEHLLVDAADDEDSVHTYGERHKIGARKKAVQLWKKWKTAMSMSASRSFADARSGSNKKLSPGLLQQHQQQQYSIDSSSIAPAAPTALYGTLAVVGAQKLPTSFEVGSAAATGGTGADSSMRVTTPTAASLTAAVAGMPGNVVHAFNSSLYEQATTPQTPPRTTPRNSVNAPHTTAAAASGQAGAPAQEWLRACSVGDGSAAAAAWAAALGQSSAAAAATGNMRLLPQVSSGSGSSSVLSPKTPSAVGTAAAATLQLSNTTTLAQQAAFTGGRCGGQEYSAVGQQRIANSQFTACTLSSSTPSQRTAISSSTAVAPLAASRGPADVTASQSVPASARLLGTALTAYPAVAAELARSCLGADDSVHCVMQIMPAGPASCSTMAAKAAAVESAASGAARSYSSRTSSSAAVPPPASAERAADVSGWLLRTALLEDELQGRALEVQECMEQLIEQREEVQAVLSRMSGGRAAQRHQATLELSSISSSIKQLTSRAAALGSALSVLQGCQTVLASNRGSMLDLSSKVAVLQLVMSEVVSRLPDEGLQQLELCQGLPGLTGPDSSRLDSTRPGNKGPEGVRLGQAGREVCRLAGVGAEKLASARSVSSITTSDIFLPSRCTRHLHGADDVAASAAAVLAAGARGDMNDTCDTVCYDDEQQQQLRSEQQHWHRYNGADDSSDDGCAAEDDDVITTLSSVLSSRHYTPRKSLSYETRKAALAAARAGPWAASAPAAPWAANQQQQPKPSLAASMADFSRRRTRSPHEGSFEVSLLNSGSNTGPGSCSWPHQQQASYRQSAQGLLQSAGSGSSSYAASLEALLASAPVGTARRTVHMSVPLASSRAASSVMSDVDDSSTMFSARSCYDGWEGRLAAWPEEESEAEAAVTAGVPDAAALEQQLSLLQQGAGITSDVEAGSMSRSSSASCVTALSQANEEVGPEDNVQLNDSGGLAATYEGVDQGAGHGAVSIAAASNSTTAPAGYSLQQSNSSSRLGNPAAAGTRDVQHGLSASVECAPVHQLLSSGVGGVQIDLNSMTVGELLQALTLAVVQRQQR